MWTDSSEKNATNETETLLFRGFLGNLRLDVAVRVVIFGICLAWATRDSFKCTQPVGIKAVRVDERR
jgi:hypothetical protein